MTNNEAIDELSVLYERCIKARQFPNKFYCSLTDGHYIDALDMAIESLEQQPCEDCISRQAVIGIVSEYAERFNGYIDSLNDSEVYAYARGLLLSIEKNINAVPPVTPQPKIGRWE